jgi:hypothetical protein
MKHNSVGTQRSFPPIRRTLSAIALVLSFVFALVAFGEPVATSWTYQGQLRSGGAAYNGTCNFQFSLWDAASAGSQVGGTQSINGVNVANGLFTVTLDFGEGFTGNFVEPRFNGDARWLATSVQCSGDGGFTPLDPRQPITAAPYALSLRPGTTIRNKAVGGVGLQVIGDSTGVWGISTGAGSAIYGESLGTGYAGQFVGRVDVAGSLNVHSPGNAIGAIGVFAVSGVSNDPNGRGVDGYATGANAAGVYGENSSGAAIWGKSTGTGPAIYGQADSSGYAGRFTGSVLVEGNLYVGGSVFKSSGTFRIDHPLDPANKFLSHSFVESPDMKNIYEGNVTTDATGSATVTLPDYFEALNRDYHYQLTVLGQFAQAIVSREIAGNTFEIHTDKPGVKVSWLVTGIRQDAYAQAHPIVVEESKPAEEQGLYLFPAGFGAGEEKQIGHSSRPAIAPGAQEPAARPSAQAPGK